MGMINTAVGFTIALMLVFILASTLIMTYLDDIFEFNSCRTRGSLMACSGCNSTTEDSSGWETFKINCHSLVGSQNNTHCYKCADWGWRTSGRGLNLLVFAVGFIALVIVFIRGRSGI